MEHQFKTTIPRIQKAIHDLSDSKPQLIGSQSKSFIYFQLAIPPFFKRRAELAETIRSIEPSMVSQVMKSLNDAFVDGSLQKRALLIDLLFHIYSRNTYIEFETRNNLISELDRRLPQMVESIKEDKSSDDKTYTKIRNSFESLSSLKIFNELEVARYISEINKKIDKIQKTKEISVTTERAHLIHLIQVGTLQISQRNWKQGNEITRAALSCLKREEKLMSESSISQEFDNFMKKLSLQISTGTPAL